MSGPGHSPSLSTTGRGQAYQAPRSNFLSLSWRPYGIYILVLAEFRSLRASERLRRREELNLRSEDHRRFRGPGKTAVAGIRLIDSQLQQSTHRSTP
jgi:hypothetical protein